MIPTKIKLKRVYDPCEKDDGLRVLTDRLWPRGVKKEALPHDVWAKAIAPTDALRKWVHADKDARWDEFVTLYEKELAENVAFADFVQQLQGHDTVTLLFASKDEAHNHATVLSRVLEEYL